MMSSEEEVIPYFEMLHDKYWDVLMRKKYCAVFRDRMGYILGGWKKRVACLALKLDEGWMRAEDYNHPYLPLSLDIEDARPAFIHRLLLCNPHITSLCIHISFDDDFNNEFVMSKKMFMMSKEDATAAVSKLYAFRLLFDRNIDVDMDLAELVDALPNASLQRLSIPEIPYGLGIGHQIGLAHALTQPGCKIWDLDLCDVIHVLQFQDFLDFQDLLFGSPNCNLLKLTTRGIPSSLEGSSLRYLLINSRSTVIESEIEPLCQFIESKDCKLEILRFYHDTGMTENSQRMLLDAVANNFTSKLRYLIFSQWKSQALEKRWLGLKRRIDLYVQHGLQFEQAEEASTLKLFVCGDGRVGKTTLTNNLCRSIPLNYPAAFQNHPSTVGMDLRHSVFYKGKELLICDIAGQEEYHAFHHFFIRGSDKDLFLVMCKIEQGYHNEKLQESLLYWLRFITTHRSSSLVRPKVLLALNHFTKDITINVDALKKIKEKFHRVLDFVTLPDGHLFFNVVATKASSLKHLKKSLKHALQVMLQNKLPIPTVCNQLLSQKQQRNQQWSKVMDLTTLAQQLKDVSISQLQFILSCLHDMGKSIYFGPGLKEEDEILSNHAILDVQWFTREVVKMFMSLQDASTDNDGKVATGIIKEKLLRTIKIQEVGFMLKLLHYMGFLIPHDEEWEKSSRWSSDNLPSYIIVPALLKRRFLCWRDKEFKVPLIEHRYWARRFSCHEDDKDYILLPSGLFSIMQAETRRLCCNSTYSLGDGWISFRENDIGVVIQVGGDTNKWIDRQWVDVILNVPQDDQERHSEAQKKMTAIKQIISDICADCPSLRLQEKVVDPSRAISYLSGKSDLQKNPLEVEILDRILEMAETKGLDFIHHWEKHCSVVGELLLPDELQACVQKWQSLRQDYEYGVAKIYGTPLIETAVSEFESPDIKLQTHILSVMLGQITSELKDTKMLLEEMKKTWKRMTIDMKTILANTSQALGYLNVANPRFPYLADEKNVITKYCNLRGKTVHLRYMCEHTEEGHPIKDAKGVEMIIEHSWYTKYSHVFVPAFNILYFVSKVGANLLPVGGGAACFAVDFVKSTLEESWKGCFDLESSKKKPNEEHVTKVFEFVKQQANAKDQHLHQFVKEHFGLYGKNELWLCERHK